MVLLVVCAVQSAGSAVHAQTRYTQAQEQRFHEQATAAIAHGRYDEAEALAATREDDDPAAVALRARLLVLRGEYPDAEALLTLLRI